MTTRHLLLTFAFLSCVSAVAEGAEIARRGNLAFTDEDFFAHHFMSSPSKVEALKGTPREVQSTISEVLAARTYNSTASVHTELKAPERRYYNMQLERAALFAELNIRERRARAAFNAEDPVLVARAREIWLTDTSRFYNEESADITQMLFDLVGRPFSDVSDRIKAAQAALASGERFEDVVTKYTDDSNARTTGGRLKGISILGTDALVGNLIFKRMKEGEVSSPTPTRVGLYIVRLDKKYPKSKKPFEEVKAKIIEQLLEEAAKNARVELIDKLNVTPIVVNDAAFEEFVGKTDPALEERRREIHRNLGTPVSEPLPK